MRNPRPTATSSPSPLEGECRVGSRAERAEKNGLHRVSWRGSLTLPARRAGPLPFPRCGRGVMGALSPSPASREREGPAAKQRRVKVGVGGNIAPCIHPPASRGERRCSDETEDNPTRRRRRGNRCHLHQHLLVARRAPIHPRRASILHDRHGTFLAQLGGSDERGYGYWPPPAAPSASSRHSWRWKTGASGTTPASTPSPCCAPPAQDLAAGRRVSGASTIAMQVARLQHPEPRTLWRKALEAGTALALTFALRPRRGAATISPHRRPSATAAMASAMPRASISTSPPRDLSWAEIALLAALPQAPSRLNPLRPGGRAQRSCAASAC